LLITTVSPSIYLAWHHLVFAIVYDIIILQLIFRALYRCPNCRQLLTSDGDPSAV